MPRYTRKSYKKVSRPVDKIIRAGSVILAAGPSTTSGFVYTATVPQTLMSFKLDIGLNNATPANVTVPYALVIVPDGYASNNITWPALTANMYEPSQNVLISGVITDVTTEDHKSIRVGRKMKTGDRIALLMRNEIPGSTYVDFELSFNALF